MLAADKGNIPMSPIILENSHSHSFSWADPETGDVHEAKVLRGMDIEPLGLPLKKLTQLMSEYVVSFDGSSRRPRYTYREEVVEADGSTYTSGVITQTLVKRQLDAQKGEGKPTLSREDAAALQRAAEEAEVADAQADLREETELAEAAREQAEKDAREQAERAATAEAELARLKEQMAAQTKADDAANGDTKPVMGTGDSPTSPKAPVVTKKATGKASK